MNIKGISCQTEKENRKLNWQLTTGLPLSQKQRDQKGDKIDELRDELKDLQKKLTEMKCTKMKVKLHLL